MSATGILNEESIWEIPDEKILLIWIIVIATFVGSIFAVDLILKIRCEKASFTVFDTESYMKGSALEGADLSKLIENGTSVFELDNVMYSSDTRIGGYVSMTSFCESPYEGSAFPAPYAVLVQRKNGESVFCNIEGVDIAPSLAEAATLVYITCEGTIRYGLFNYGYSCKVYAVTTDGNLQWADNSSCFDLNSDDPVRFMTAEKDGVYLLGTYTDHGRVGDVYIRAGDVYTYFYKERLFDGASHAYMVSAK